MKKLLTIILICTPLIGVPQINGIWIAVKSKPLYSGLIAPIDGTIFNFDTAHLQLINSFSENIIEFEIKIRNKIIYRGDSVFAQILHMSKDSLILNFNNRMQTLFHPLQLTVPMQITDKYLIDNSWVIDYGSAQQAIDFLDRYWRMEYDSTSKISVTRNEGNWYGGDIERWNLLNLKEGQIFIKTYGQTTPYVYGITAFNEDTIKLYPTYGLNLDTVLLIKRKELNINDYHSIASRLTGKVWYTDEFVEIIEPDHDVLGFPTFITDSTLIYEQEFLNKKVKYKFKEDRTYGIYVTDNLRKEGTWSLKNDGQIVVLDAGINPADYLKIKELTERKLIISGSSDIVIKRDDKLYMEIFYYTIKLKN